MVDEAKGRREQACRHDSFAFQAPLHIGRGAIHFAREHVLEIAIRQEPSQRSPQLRPCRWTCAPVRGDNRKVRGSMEHERLRAGRSENPRRPQRFPIDCALNLSRNDSAACGVLALCRCIGSHRRSMSPRRRPASASPCSTSSERRNFSCPGKVMAGIRRGKARCSRAWPR